MKTSFRIAALLAVCVLFASVLAAQQHPNQEKGFAADKTYSLGDVDSINMYNGNLSVSLPIGPKYAGNGNLGYQLALSYSGNVLDFTLMPDRFPLNVPGRRANAGLGWLLSLGRIIPPSDETNYTYDTSTSHTTQYNNFAPDTHWLYEGSDGSDHVFYDTLHDAGDMAYPAATMLTSPAARKYGYTRDSTYMRLHITSATQVEVEFADGTKQVFKELDEHTFCEAGTSGCASAAGHGTFRLVSIVDRFGNAVTISYSSSGGNTEIWTISDANRTNKVYLKEGIQEHHRIVDKVELASTAGTATYQFNYTIRWIHANIGDLFRPDVPHAYEVSTLTSVTFPSINGVAQTYEMEYLGLYPSEPPTSMLFTRVDGHLRKLTLPTRGSIEWEYGLFDFAVEDGVDGRRSRSVGVTTRKTVAQSTTLGTWNYGHALSGAVSCNGGVAGYPQIVSSVTPPEGATTINYYSTWSGTDFAVGSVCPEVLLYGGAHEADDFMLPFVRRKSKSIGGGASVFLSTETRIPPAPGALPDLHTSSPGFELSWGTLLRSTYTSYESEPVHTEVLTGGRGAFDTNRRVNAGLTEYNDDPVGSAFRESHVRYLGFDGYGHYKQTSSGGNFPTGETGDGNFQTSFVGYSNATLAAEPDKTWILGMHTERCNASDSAERTSLASGCAGLTAPTTAKANFESSTGFQLAERTLRSGAANGPSDFLKITGHENNGNVSTERYYGGDLQPLDLSSFTPPATPGYEVVHASSYNGAGALTGVKTSFTGISLYTNDVTLDPATNAALSQRTSSNGSSPGLATSFQYDLLGRVVESRPDQGAVTRYVYYDASGNGSAAISVSQYQNGASFTNGGTTAALLTSLHYSFDAFGRVVREGKLMPGGGFISRRTLFSPAGRKAATSEWYPDAQPVYADTLYSFDDLGRPSTITPPDDPRHAATFSYVGATKVTRTTGKTVDGVPGGMGVSYSGTTVTEAPSVRTETYDSAGRLISVVEPSGPAGADTQTNYSYDVTSHLTKVSTTLQTQTRTFSYDSSGMLIQEDHPENGVTSYSQFDARGHATEKANGGTKLYFEFDKAERLKKVKSGPMPVGATTIKEFEFDRPNTTHDFSLGKLDYAIRHNSVLGGDIQVKETYTYGGTGGQISAKRTEITGGPTFDQTFSYNDLGQTLTLGYPTCTGCGGAAGKVTTITNGYTNGLLTSVPGYASSITYSTNGTLNVVTHANGVVDTVTPDDHRMARPKSITFSNFCDGLAITTQPADPAPLNAAGNVTLTAVATGSPTWQWYRGPSGDPSLPISGATSATLTMNVTTPGSYWARATAGTCLIDTRTVLVRMNGCNTPNAAIGGVPAGTVYGGQTINVSVDEVTGATYAWTISGGTATSATNQRTFTFATGCSGTATAGVTVTAACGPSASSTRVISITPSTAMVTGSATIPSGQNATVHVALTGNPPFDLVWEDDSTQTVSASGTINRTITTPSNGQHTYYLKSVSTHGCTVTPSGSAVITVGTCVAPDATVEAVPAGYPGAEFHLEARDQPGVTYQWSVMGGTDTFVSGRFYNFRSACGVSYSTVHLTVTRTATMSCPVAVDQSDTNVFSSVPFFSTTGNADILSGNSTNLTVFLNGPPPFIVDWGDGTQPEEVSGTTAVHPVHPTSTTTYSMITARTASLACYLTHSGGYPVVNVSPCPSESAAISGLPAALAAGAIVEVSTDVHNAYSWSVSGGTAVSATNGRTFAFIAGCSGNATVNLTVTNSCGNTASASQAASVTVPTVTVSGTATVFSGTSTPVQAALTGTPPWNVTWSDGIVQTGVTSSPLIRSVAPSSTITYTATATASGCQATASGSAVITVKTAPSAPVNLTATATSTTSAFITFHVTGTIGAYELVRSSVGGQTLSMHTCTTPCSGSVAVQDTGLASGVTYLYKVRAYNAATDPVAQASPFSNTDPATTVLFTDDPISPGLPVKAVHVTELRTAVNALRLAAGLTAFSFTDAVAYGTPVRAIHIQELRTALNQARAQLGLTVLTFTDAGLAAHGVIRVPHVQELREGVE
jgi:hypothetical protein